MKIVLYTLFISTLLSVHISTECMELENVPTPYKTIGDLLASEHYRSDQFSDKIVSFKEDNLLIGNGDFFKFQAYTPYTITNHTINSARVKKTIKTEFNDQCNKIRLETSHICFGIDQKYTIKSISVTDLPTQQIKPEPAPVLPTTNIQSTVTISNNNIETIDHANRTIIIRNKTDNDFISSDCLLSSFIILSSILTTNSPLKKIAKVAKFLALILPRIAIKVSTACLSQKIKSNAIKK